MSEWFNDWFNSKEYLQVYHNRNEKEANQFADSIISFIQTNSLFDSANIDLQNKVQYLPQNLTLLDMACGFGRHSITFAKRGFNVVGIDISGLLLNIAKKRAEENNITNVSFLQSDIRDFNLQNTSYYPSPDGFDFAINVFTSFGYFENDEENFQIFTQATRHIKNGGYFVFDFLNSVYVRNNLIEFTQSNVDGMLIKQTRKIVNNCVVKEIIISQNNDSLRALPIIGEEINISTNESKFYKEIVKLYPPSVLVDKLKKAGLYPIVLWGNYAGDGFDENSSERFIAICRKQSIMSRK